MWSSSEYSQQLNSVCGIRLEQMFVFMVIKKHVTLCNCGTHLENNGALWHTGVR